MNKLPLFYWRFWFAHGLPPVSSPPLRSQPLLLNLEWPYWSIHKANNMMAYFHSLFSNNWHGPGSCPVAERALVDLYPFCLFGFDFIGLTPSQYLSPFLIIQGLAASLGSPLQWHVSQREGSRELESFLMGPTRDSCRQKVASGSKELSRVNGMEIFLFVLTTQTLGRSQQMSVLSEIEVSKYLFIDAYSVISKASGPLAPPFLC